MNELDHAMICLMKALLMICLFNLFFGSFSMPKYKKNVHITVFLITFCVYAVSLSLVSWDFFNLGLFIIIACITSLLYDLKGYVRVLLLLVIVALSYVSIISTSSDITLSFFGYQSAQTDFVYYSEPLLSNTIFWFFVLCIRVGFKKYFFYETVMQPVAILLVPISLLMMIQIMYFCIDQLPSVKPSLITAINACCYLFMIFGVIVYYYLEKICDETQKNIELNVAQGIITKQSEQYAQLLKSNQEIMKIRHDYNNLTIGLISEIEKGNYEVAMKELHRQKQVFNNSAKLSENLGIIHLIVEQKRKIAGESNIAIEFSYHDLCRIRISDIDLAIILGNALDNAIDASRLLPPDVERKIELSIKMHNNNIVVLIKNNVVENIDVDNLSTTKKLKHLHGFGIESMRQLVGKYNGDLIFNCQNCVFETHIMLTNCDD